MRFTILVLFFYLILNKGNSQQILISSTNGNCLDSNTLILSSKIIPTQNWWEIQWYNFGQLVKTVFRSGTTLAGNSSNTGGGRDNRSSGGSFDNRNSNNRNGGFKKRY